jgi:hypothetical protein
LKADCKICIAIAMRLLKTPVANKLYLEDLAISIPEFERMVKQPKKVFETYRGFAVDEAFKAEEINND